MAPRPANDRYDAFLAAVEHTLEVRGQVDRRRDGESIALTWRPGTTDARALRDHERWLAALRSRHSAVGG